MSSVRGGGFPGRGRGNTFNSQSNTPFGGSSSTRGTPFGNAPARGAPAGRSPFGQAPRANGVQFARGGGGFPRGGNHFKQQSTMPKSGAGGVISSGTCVERQEKLQKHRDQERKQAIAQGLMSDPDKQIGLSEAITIVGTCQDMCPEHERVLRTVRNEVWAEEKEPNPTGLGSGEAEPDEARMVKAFRRSAAGDEVQIPSDLRPPPVLKRTCDYLFNEVIGHAPALEKVHHFVWDRTRAIRNDFSIQQLTRLGDLKIAIDCYERIARFHIVSLHELAGPKRPYGKYDPQQEREQLDRTLLSLMQYYDDTRGRLELPNEAEFRAYCIILQLRDPTPDLEDRVQSWPSSLTDDRRVRAAVQIYTAACSTIWPEGPIAKTQHVVARQDWDNFWKLIESPKVSYLLACVAETHFMMIREMALGAIVRSARVTKKRDGVLDPNTEWTLEELDRVFFFDTEEDLESFCGRWNLSFQTREEDGQQYLDIRHLAGKPLPKGEAAKTSQLKSLLVEEKRHGRTIPAVIDGLVVSQARDAGLVVEEEGDDEEEEEMGEAAGGEDDEAEEAEDDEESLFIPEKKTADEQREKLANGFGFGSTEKVSAFGQTTSPFSQPKTASPFAQSSPFGRPSSGFSFKPVEASQTNANAEKKSPFSFGSAKPKLAEDSPNPSPKTLDFKPEAPASGSSAGTFGAQASTSTLSPFGQPSKTSSPLGNAFAPKTTPTADAPSTSGLLGGTFGAGLPKSDSSPFGQPPTTNSSLENPFAPKTAPTDASSASAAAAAPDKAPTSTPTFQFPSLTPKSDPPPAADKPSFQFGLTNAPAAPSLPAPQPETNLKPPPSQVSQSQPQAQPHSASASQQTQHTAQNATISNSGSQSPPRRPSATSWEAHKTKKPSPLSNSFTAGDESASLLSSSQSQLVQAPGKQSTRELFPDRQSAKSRQTKPTQLSAEDEQLQKLANSLTFDERNGFLKQFLDYSVQHVITKVQEKVFYEQCMIKCRALEETRLIRVYGTWWRAFARHRRLAAKSRQRRERTRERLRKSTAGSSWDGYSDTAANSIGRGSLPSLGRPQRDRKDVLDTLFKSVSGDMQATGGSKRSAPTNGQDKAVHRDTTHKRQKSMSHVDDRGRISKAAPTSNSNADLLKRSSFLGYSTAGDPTVRPSTTKSTYFRMKAMGLNPGLTGTAASEPRGTKRQRSESFDLDKIRASRRSTPSASAASPEQQRDGEAMPPPATKPKTNDEDEILFARLRAAREALQESGTFMKDEMRRSMSASASSNESPSMERARAEARLRMSSGYSDFDGSASSRSVPAYQLRESRFVPREEYGRARERALEMRASRSRDNSRSVSRGEDGVAEVSDNSLSTTAPKMPDFSHAATGRDTTAPKVNGQTSAFQSQGGGNANPFSGFGGASGPSSMSAYDFNATPAQSAKAPPAFGSQKPVSQTTSRNPFSQTSPFAPPAPANQNPFLQASAPGPFGMASKTFAKMTGDHTVQPPQINQSLARTFGRPGPGAAAPATQGSPTPDQTNSYMPLQAASAAISLLSDDEEGGADEVSFGQGQFFGNGTQAIPGQMDYGDQNGTQSFEQEEDASTNFMRGAYGYANSFAALADPTGEDDNELNAGDEGFEDQQTYQSTRGQPDSYQYSDDQPEGDYNDGYDEDGNPIDGYEGDEEAPNGYYDEEEGDDEDEGDFDDEDEEDYDEDEDEDDNVPAGRFAPLNHAYTQRAQQQVPKGDPALQMIGNSAEEAIELSD